MKISIIIPHYQKQATFLETAPNLLGQLEKGDEVIIVDDYSPGGFTIKHPQLRVVRPPSSGAHVYRISTLRNFGLEEAVNDTCLILDPDCKIFPHFLEMVRKTFNSGCVYGCRIDFQREDLGVDPDPRLTRNWPLGWMIWGGCMILSKSRTSLARVNHQWFREEFNGKWGVEDNDFANRCYHSGMALIYAKSLRCIHLYHPRRYDGIQENQKLAVDHLQEYKENLDQVSDYKPRVGVLLVTLMRWEFLEQCLYSLARVRIPIKIYLVNQADKSLQTMAVINKWKGKWSVIYKENTKLEGLAAMKRWGMQQMKTDGLDYTVIIDDDVCLMTGGLEKLVECADNHPDIHSIAGWLDEGTSKYQVGGFSLETPLGTRFPRLNQVSGMTEVGWVGGGFTIHRLEPLVLHDPAYLIGLEDYDYSLILKSKGMKCAVLGEAKAYHKLLFKGGRLLRPGGTSSYHALRMNAKKIQRSKDHLRRKWGIRVI